jgi:hypothetical protein
MTGEEYAEVGSSENESGERDGLPAPESDIREGASECESCDGTTVVADVVGACVGMAETLIVGTVTI